MPNVSSNFGLPTRDLHEPAGAAVRRVLPFEEHRPREAAGKERNGARERRALHAGHRRRPLERFALELLTARLGIALPAEIERQRREVLGVEAGVDPLRVLKAAEEQAGADQRDERQRHLRRHEQVPQAEDAARSRRRAALLLQLDDQIGPRRLNAPAPGRTERRSPARRPA